MRKYHISIAVFFLLIFAFSLQAKEKKTNWDQLIAKTNWQLYSKNLVKAIKSDNLGLKVSAMQQIIKYKKYVKVDEIVLDLVRLYRRYNDDRVRQLALVTLYSLQNDWAWSIIKRDYEYEGNPQIKRMLSVMLNENMQNIDEKKESDRIIASIYDMDR